MTDTELPTAPPLRTRSERRADAHRRRDRKRRRIVLVGVAAAVLVPLLAGGIWFWLQIEPPGDPGRRVAVEVRRGWGTGEIADELSEAEVIGSALAFRVWAKLSGAGPFESGHYEMRRDLGVSSAIATLEDGPRRAPDTKFLLRPALTMRQIAERIGRLPGRSSERFLEIVSSGTIRSQTFPEVTNLEGLMFPDTYFVGANESEESIARRLVARFDEIAVRVGLTDAVSRNGLTPYETVVAASLLQTEAKLAEDAPLIAAVITNRLRQDMALQIDSTLCYAKGGCPPSPTNADKQIESAYNTYRIQGLPPTPIASVTEANLAAMLTPADVPYLFYVLIQENGKHAFASTLAEHESNVAEARRRGLL